MDVAHTLTVAEAAAAGGYSPRTIEYYIATGELESRKVGGRRVIPEDALESWLAGRGQRVAS